MNKEELTDLILKFFVVKRGEIALRAIHVNAMEELADIILEDCNKIIKGE